MASQPYPDTRRGVWVMKVRPDPNGAWKRVVLGKDERLLGSRPPKTPPQSILDKHHELCEIEYAAKHGIRQAPARAKGLAGYLAGYVEAFKASHKTGSCRQLGRHVENFRAYLEAQGVTTVQGVTRSHCRNYLDVRIAKVSHDTLQTEMKYLAPIWSRAVEDGLMAANPWSRLKVPGKSTRSDPVFWGEEEVARIAAACSKAWQSDLVLVMAYTGLRINTALALAWSWVDWNRGIVTIPRELSARRDGVKTSYEFFLLDEARDVLERRHFASRSALVFPNPHRGGGVVPYDSAREAIARAIEKAGVKPGTAHDLRHSYGRMLERRGIPASIIQVQLGHSSAAMTALYTGSNVDEAARFFRARAEAQPAPPGPSRPPS